MVGCCRKQRNFIPIEVCEVDHVTCVGQSSDQNSNRLQFYNYIPPYKLLTLVIKLTAGVRLALS